MRLFTFLLAFIMLSLCPSFIHANLYEWVDKNGQIHLSDQKPDQGKIVRELKTHSFPDGKKYVGEFKNGKPHGQGAMAYPDGGRYEGEFKDGKAHGKGAATYSTTLKYLGDWQNGKPHGKGEATFANGKKYAGEWRDGKTHGPGEITHPDGSKYEGGFEHEKVFSERAFTDSPVDGSHDKAKRDDCYDFGYRYGMHTAKLKYHLPTGTEDESSIPERCYGKNTTKKGVTAGINAVRWMVGD